MNVGTNLFEPSQGVETGIREEIVEILAAEFQTEKDVSGESQPLVPDEISDKMLNYVRSGHFTIPQMLSELVENSESITGTLSPILLTISSLFLPQNKHADILKELLSQLLKPSDPIFTILMIAINKASYLDSKDLLENWQRTLCIVILSMLNSQVKDMQKDQVSIYLDKLGEALFTAGRTSKESYLGLFLIFAAKQRIVYEFLDKYAKNSWRIDLNINLLCSIHNLLYEEEPDVYELTMLKLSFNRGYICYQSGISYYENALKYLNVVMTRKQYLQHFKLQKTVDDAMMIKDKVMTVLNYQNRKEEVKHTIKGIFILS